MRIRDYVNQIPDSVAVSLSPSTTIGAGAVGFFTSGAFMLTLFVLLVALNVADLVLTRSVLEKGGRELNPLLAALFKRMGPIPAMLIVKIPFLLAVYFLMPQVPIVVMQVLVVGYACLMLWNIAQLQRR